VPGRLRYESLTGVRQRVDRVDMRSQRALVNKTGDFPELGACVSRTK
jgi:hypothetical protein